MSKDRINFIVPLWNRAENIKDLLNNVEDIIQQTGDKNIRMIIGDYHSTDINMETYLYQNQFSYPIELVKFDGDFIIGHALQICGEKVTDNNEILFFCDVDAFISDEFFDVIRKHTIKGKQFFCPLVSRQLKDGSLYTWNDANYFKDGKRTGGVGHIMVYVEDWERSGGWKKSKFMRKVTRGGHDTYMYKTLLKIMKCHRHLETKHYTKYHPRSITTSKWYSEMKYNPTFQ